jgi:hypothetical protein
VSSSLKQLQRRGSFLAPVKQFNQRRSSSRSNRSSRSDSNTTSDGPAEAAGEHDDIWHQDDVWQKQGALKKVPTKRVTMTHGNHRLHYEHAVGQHFNRALSHALAITEEGGEEAV